MLTNHVHYRAEFPSRHDDVLEAVCERTITELEVVNQVGVRCDFTTTTGPVDAQWWITRVTIVRAEDEIVSSEG
jgi:hypothetical protein